MAKYFRLYAKKRGSRRTDASRAGDVVRVLLYSVLFFGGLGFATYLLATLIVPEWRVNREFRQVDCLLVGKRLLEVEQRDGTQMFRPEFQIEYQVAGNPYLERTYDITRTFSTDRESQRRVLDQFEVGETYPCWYDPRDPSTVVLVRGYTLSSWLLLLVPVTFVIAGGSGLTIALLNWNKSVERRASLAQKTVPLEMFGDSKPREDFPTVPHRPSYQESRGTRLAYRLPVDLRTVWLLTGLGALFATMVLIAGLATTFGLISALEGNADWMFLLFAAGWLVIGVVGLMYVSRRLLQATSAGPTILEISGLPLLPGESYELYLRQPGRARLKRLALSLVCEERATSQQGTNTRTEVRRVLNSEITSQQDVQLARRNPFEGQYTLQLPRHVMHSFKSPHSAVEWKLLLAGEGAKGFRFERSFPVIVWPAGEAHP